ncbi:MAG: YafY family protein [bacterium]
MRLERLISMIFMLLNRKQVSASELARRFNVSVRTIYRDLDTIDCAGIPLTSQTGRQGGFAIMDTYRIDRQVLSFREISSIINALKGINATLEDQAVNLTIEKIATLLPRSASLEVLDDHQSLALDFIPWGYPETYRNLFKTLYQVTENQRITSIDYHKPSGNTVRRTIEPMTLLFKGYNWYVFAYCRLRQDYRIFRLSRIKNLQLTDKFFTRRKKKYTDLSHWTDSSPKKIDLTLKFSPRLKTIVEDYFKKEQLTYKNNGNIIAEVQFPESDWVYGYILGFGPHVEVLKPGHVREKIARSAEKIYKIYKP